MSTSAAVTLLFLTLSVLTLVLCLLLWRSAATRSHSPGLERCLDVSASLPAARPALVPEQYYLWQNLTEQEKQVARHAAQGKSDAEIARELSIAESSVGNHLQKIYAKLKIRSRPELEYILRELVDGPHYPTRWR